MGTHMHDQRIRAAGLRLGNNVVEFLLESRIALIRFLGHIQAEKWNPYRTHFLFLNNRGCRCRFIVGRAADRPLRQRRFAAFCLYGRLRILWCCGGLHGGIFLRSLGDLAAFRLLGAFWLCQRRRTTLRCRLAADRTACHNGILHLLWGTGTSGDRA